VILELAQWSIAFSAVASQDRLSSATCFHNLTRQPSLFPSTLNPSSVFDLEDYPVARREPRILPPDPYYLDRIAKPQFSLAKIRGQKKPENCQYWAAIGHCENGHRFARRLNCGREWCDKCREEIEARRVARLLPKVQQMSSMAYWVITIHRELCPLLRSKRSRGIFAKRVRRAFKELGYLRGLDRWHPFGDKNHDYFPHLNVLVDGEWLEPEQLERLKSELRRMIFSKRIRKRYNDKLDIHYEYRDTPGKIMHTLKYVCRSTFLDKSWDEALAEASYNFRNAGWWGKWDQAPKWDVIHDHEPSPELVDLANGICPICSTKITWSRKPTTVSHILIQGAVEIAAGYYSLPAFKHRHKSRASPLSHLPSYLTDDQLTPKQLLRLWQIHQVEP